MNRNGHQLKRLIYNGMVFILSSLAVYCLFIFTFSRLQLNDTPAIYRFVKGLVWKGGYTLPRFRDFKTDKSYDVLVFGSSTANRSINPAIFENHGISVYNLGTDDQTPLNTEVLVKHYTANDKPRLVILDIYDKVFCQSPYEAAADFIQNTNSNHAALRMALQLGDIRSLNMMAVRMATLDFPPILPARDTLHNGFRSIKHRINNFSPDNYVYHSDPKQLAAFESTLAYLQKNDIPVILTIQPKPVFYLEENHKAFMNDLAPILEKYQTNVVALTMLETGLEMADYADMSHLNKYGADKYSSALLNTIRKRSLLAEN